MRQIRQQNSGRCPMTDAGWAERKVEQATTGYSWNARIRKSTVILPSIADIETNRRPARGYELKTLCHLFAVTPKQLVGHE